MPANQSSNTGFNVRSASLITSIKGVKPFLAAACVLLAPEKPNTSALGGRVFNCASVINAFNFVPNTASNATLQFASIFIFCQSLACLLKPWLCNQWLNCPSAFSDCCIFSKLLISASATLAAFCASFCLLRKARILACCAVSSSRILCKACSAAAILVCVSDTNCSAPSSNTLSGSFINVKSKLSF